MGSSQSGHEEPRPLKPGDLIEIDRGDYKHWGTYIGDNEVVHLVTNDTGSSLSDSEGAVMRQNLSHVVNGDRYQVNNRLDDKYKPRDPEVIVIEARERVGQPVTYNVVSNNCEHFATEMRYDKPESQQVVEKVIQGALGASLGGGMALSLGASQGGGVRASLGSGVGVSLGGSGALSLGSSSSRSST